MFKNNIIPIILIGIVIAGFFIFVSPTYSELAIIKTQIASYDEALNNSKSLENERDRLTKTYSSFDTNDLEKLQKLLPDNVDNIRLILEIEKIAQPYGMALKDVKYDSVVADTKTKEVVPAGAAVAVNAKNYGTWNLQFATQGSYDNFLSFIKDLENNLRIVDIESIDFSSDSTLGSGMNITSSDTYKYNIKIKTYWLKN